MKYQRVSADMRVRRHVDQLSADMLVACWLTCRSTVGRHVGRECRPTEVFITQIDPVLLLFGKVLGLKSELYLICETSSFLGLMNAWFGIGPLVVFQAINFCFTSETALQLIKNLHSFAKLFAMLSELVNSTEIFPLYK